jgi:hypothetical protein
VALSQARELIGAGARALIQRGFSAGGRDQEADRVLLGLVGADREPVARRLEPVEGLDHAGKEVLCRRRAS